jgi:hypothetical protein
MIGYLLTRPVGRSPHEVRRYSASFQQKGAEQAKTRRVVAKGRLASGRACSGRRIHRHQSDTTS